MCIGTHLRWLCCDADKCQCISDQLIIIDDGEKRIQTNKVGFSSFKNIYAVSDDYGRL